VLATVLVELAVLVRVIVELLFFVVLVLVVYVVEPGRLVPFLVVLGLAELVALDAVSAAFVLAVVVRLVLVTVAVAGRLLVVALQVVLAVLAGVALVKIVMVLVAAVAQRALREVMAGLLVRTSSL